MKKEARIFIEHILECIELIERYTEGKTKDEFLSSVQFQDSVIRRIEIIGEAIKGIHDEIKSKYPRYPMEEDCRYERYSYSRVFWNRYKIDMGGCNKRHS